MRQVGIKFPLDFSTISRPQPTYLSHFPTLVPLFLPLFPLFLFIVLCLSDNTSVFFITQLIVDILCARFADRIGYRRCVVGSQLFSAAGLLGLAFLPQIMPDPFMGIIISTIVYAVGSGLTEVLVSPIVEACPFEHKEAAMSLLHSFYCWGSVGVILLSTVFFSVFGIDNWKWLACIWAIIPLYK